MRELPDNTADAVASGALYAAAGAIDRFRAVVAQRFGARAGLDAERRRRDDFAGLVAGAERVNDLVLRGLALWADAPAAAG